MSKLYVVEGSGDGVGKSTQYELLKERFIQDGENVTTHHFPSYNTFHGEPVTRYLKGELGEIEDLSPYFINSLYGVDRAIAWNLFLKKQYLKGDIILLDRYTTSSLIYQMAVIDDVESKKDFIKYVEDFEYNKLGVKKPDKVIFLHVAFELTKKMLLQRKNNPGVVEDIHETDLDFLKIVYENSLFVAEYLGWDFVECAKDNELRGINDIHEDVYKLVKKR